METVKKKIKAPGRPGATIKKNVRAAVRLSGSEYFIIKGKAAKAGITVSDYLRQTAIGASIQPRLTPEELQDARLLAGMSNNINQVAKTCNQQGLYEAMRCFEQYRKVFDELLKKFKP